jgi:hypothetical protein
LGSEDGDVHQIEAVVVAAAVVVSTASVHLYSVVVVDHGRCTKEAECLDQEHVYQQEGDQVPGR